VGNQDAGKSQFQTLQDFYQFLVFMVIDRGGVCDNNLFVFAAVADYQAVGPV